MFKDIDWIQYFSEISLKVFLCELYTVFIKEVVVFSYFEIDGKIKNYCSKLARFLNYISRFIFEENIESTIKREYK